MALGGPAPTGIQELVRQDGQQTSPAPTRLWQDLLLANRHVKIWGGSRPLLGRWGTTCHAKETPPGSLLLGHLLPH
jgi:hypothetical protein